MTVSERVRSNFDFAPEIEFDELLMRLELCQCIRCGIERCAAIEQMQKKHQENVALAFDAKQRIDFFA